MSFRLAPALVVAAALLAVRNLLEPEPPA